MKLSRFIAVIVVILVLLGAFSTDVVSYDILFEESDDGMSEVRFSGKLIKLPLSICYIDAKLELNNVIYKAKSYRLNQVLSGENEKSYIIEFKESVNSETIYDVTAQIIETSDRQVKDMYVILTSHDEQDVDTQSYYYKLLN